MHKLLFAAMPLFSSALIAQGTSEATEPNNTTATATVLATGMQGYGDIDVTGIDEDWFKITLASTSDLKVWTNPGFVGQIGDTRVKVLAADGITVLIDMDDGNFAVHGYYTTFVLGGLVAGDYYVNVRGYDAFTFGSYTLDVVEAVPGTYAPLFPPLTPVAEGLEVNDPRVLLGVATPSAIDTLNSGNTLVGAGGNTTYTSLTADYDFYQINVAAAGPLQMETITGAATPANLDTVIHLVDSSLAQIAFDDEGGVGSLSLLNFNIVTPGTYYVAVHGWGTGSIGNYVLRITLPPAPLPTGPATTTVQVGGCVGTAGTPSLSNRLSTTGTNVRTERAVLGSQFWLDGTNLPANAPLLRVAGFVPLGTPFDLGSYGAPGCFVEVDPLAVVFTVADAAGVDFWNLNLPGGLAFNGLNLEQQLVVLDAGANALGVTASNRVSSVCGITH